MDLLNSASVPCHDNENALVTDLSCNDNYIAVALTNAYVHVFSCLDCSHVASFKDPCGEFVWAVSIVDDKVIIGSVDGALRVWRVNESTLLQTITSLSTASADSKSLIIEHLHVLAPRTNPSLLVITSEGSIRQWILGSDTYNHSFINGHNGEIARIRSFQNDSKFISSSYEGTVCAWDVDNGSLTWRAKMEVDVFGLDVGEAGVAVGLRDGGVQILNIINGTLIASFQAHAKVVNGLIFYQHHLISTGTDGFAKVWTASSDNTYALERSTQLHDKAIMKSCLIGSRLITGGKNGGAAENACGRDCSTKLWKLGGQDVDSIEELGVPVEMVWQVVALHQPGKLAVALRKRGKPILEIWQAR